MQKTFRITIDLDRVPAGRQWLAKADHLRQSIEGLLWTTADAPAVTVEEIAGDTTPCANCGHDISIPTPPAKFECAECGAVIAESDYQPEYVVQSAVVAPSDIAGE